MQPNYFPGAQTAALSLNDFAYLANSDIFKGVESDLLQETKDTVGSQDIEAKVKDKIFPQIQKMLVEKVKTMVKDPKVRQQFVDKIAAIKFEGSNCGDGGRGEYISGILMANAFYYPPSNTFKFCSGWALTNKSEFSIAFLIAHELSHSIDPCGATLGPSDFSFKYPRGGSEQQTEADYPIPGVIQCLRSNQSVGAIFTYPQMGPQN